MRPRFICNRIIAAYTPTGTWYKNFIYETSAERGEPESEDQYSPGYFVAKLDQGYQVSILASLRNQQVFSIEGLRYREMQRVRKIMAKLPAGRFFSFSLLRTPQTLFS